MFNFCIFLLLAELQDRWNVVGSPGDSVVEVSHGPWALNKTDVGLVSALYNGELALHAKLDNPFSSKDKTTIIQMSVKFMKHFPCHDSLLKVFSSNISSPISHSTPHLIAFGPTHCQGKSWLRSSLNYDGKLFDLKTNIPIEKDNLTHVYTLIIDGETQSYSILIDNEIVNAGLISKDWEMLQPEQIEDKLAIKPADWDNRQFLFVEEVETSPAEPREIPDESATVPEDWDVELDGEWERPTRLNPKFHPPRYSKSLNPNFKGKWTPPLINNPEYVYDSSVGQYEDISSVGFTFNNRFSGTLIDNIIITDDLLLASNLARKIVQSHEDEPIALAEFEQQESDRIERLRSLDYSDDELYHSPVSSVRKPAEEVEATKYHDEL